MNTRKGYHKEVDRSMMDWGFTIPQEYINDFLGGKSLALGSSRPITIEWGKNEYLVKICHVNRKNYNSVHQIRWDSNKDFLSKLIKSFVQSYVILKSQKELFDKKLSTKKYFRTNMKGGQQEVIRFSPINSKKIIAKEFIVIKNEWNTLFQRLVEENVFGWIFDQEKKEYLIQKSTTWYNVSQFNSHKHACNVIYYLAHTKKKLIYIGKAHNFGTRVKPGRKHQEMPGDWDKFKYDIIRPEFKNILKRIEDHTIRTTASIIKNNKKYPSLNIGNYTIVNDTWKKL